MTHRRLGVTASVIALVLVGVMAVPAIADGSAPHPTSLHVPTTPVPGSLVYGADMHTHCDGTYHSICDWWITAERSSYSGYRTVEGSSRYRGNGIQGTGCVNDGTYDYKSHVHGEWTNRGQISHGEYSTPGEGVTVRKWDSSKARFNCFDPPDAPGLPYIDVGQ